jgi:5'-deoxynucleotidase YfbR-like HD superfamily hydrolase
MNPAEFLGFYLLAPVQSKDKGRVGWWPQLGPDGRMIRPGLTHPERDAERVGGHTTGVATLVMMAIHVPELSDGLDMMRAMQMAIVHDMLGEWKDGDTNGHHTEPDKTRVQGILEEKKRQERADAEEACAPLPHHVREFYLELWEEYNSGTSPEAKLVKQFDKLDFLLTGLFYLQSGEPVPLREEFLPNVRRKIKHPWLLELVCEIERQLLH